MCLLFGSGEGVGVRCAARGLEAGRWAGASGCRQEIDDLVDGFFGAMVRQKLHSPLSYIGANCNGAAHNI